MKSLILIILLFVLNTIVLAQDNLPGIDVNPISFTNDYGYILAAQANRKDIFTPIGFGKTDFHHANAQYIKESEPPKTEIISFKVSTSGLNAELFWETVTEVNNAGFEIERLQDLNPKSVIRDEHWSKIGFVNGKGTTTEPQNYTFIDADLLSGKYIYRLKQIDLTDSSFQYSSEIQAEISPLIEFVVDQNYPNPFNPATIIKFHIPKSGKVSLRVYDTVGNTVATLLDDYRDKGSYEIKFDASALASGIYFYRFSTNQFVDVKKMVLLK